MTFAESVKELVEVKDGHLYQKLTDDQRKALTNIQTAQNAETVAKITNMSVKAVQIENAIRDANSDEGTSDVTGIFADKVDVNAGDGKEHVYPCAACKSANIITAKLVDATVTKLYAGICVKSDEKVNVTKNSVGSNINTALFQEPVAAVDTSTIVKNVNLTNAELSTTAFPQGMKYARLLNSSLMYKASLMDLMIYDFLEEAAKGNEEKIRTAYRNINRSTQEKIFELTYRTIFGPVDISDPYEIERYKDLKEKYFSGVSLIGQTHLSPITVRFGLTARTMRISPKPIWENKDKVAKIKQFGDSGSFYFTGNMASGPRSVPTTENILKKYLPYLIALMSRDFAIFEAETIAENGIEGVEIKIPDMIKIPEYTNTRKYYDILGISESDEADILADLEKKYKELATQVCSDTHDREDRSGIVDLNAALGK